MRPTRPARLTGIAVAAALALAACGSGGSTSASAECPSGTLNAEGSSAQQNAIEQAIDSYGDKCADAKVNYNPTGSGAGITQFTAGQVDFAGSDSALRTEAANGKVESEAAKTRCRGNEAWDLPMVAGPIAVAYNLAGVGKLVLTSELAAKLFLGQITTWDNPLIAALNPGVSLPPTKVSVFFRADESGTTENFEKYLADSAPSVFTDTPSKKWAGKVGEPRAKSAGVADGVKNTPGGITYVEWSFARDSKLGVAQIDNGAGAVALTGATAGRAVAAATPSGTGNGLRLELKYATKEAGVYPIILVTYEIVCSKGLDADKTALVKSFLTHLASAEAQASFEEIGYAPLPDEVRTKVAAAIEAIS